MGKKKAVGKNASPSSSEFEEVYLRILCAMFCMACRGCSLGWVAIGSCLGVSVSLCDPEPPALQAFSAAQVGLSEAASYEEDGGREEGSSRQAEVTSPLRPDPAPEEAPAPEEGQAVKEESTNAAPSTELESEDVTVGVAREDEGSTTDGLAEEEREDPAAVQEYNPLEDIEQSLKGVRVSCFSARCSPSQTLSSPWTLA
jgi:hypothetical protein